MSSDTQSVDTSELIARAEALTPVLANRARGAEEARRVPDETIADLRAGGLLRVGKPSRFGGHGLDARFHRESSTDERHCCHDNC